MNCADVTPFLIEPTNDQAVREHLEGCEACRALEVEARRVASIVADLPAARDPGIAARVMAQIGYGNGRPTRDKISDQLQSVRGELDEIWAEVEEDELHVRLTDEDQTIAEVLEHLPSAEAFLGCGSAGDGIASGNSPSGAAWAASKAGEDRTSATTAGNHAQDVRSELRWVRERTLRFVAGLSEADLGYSQAEALRSIYRHEAEHAAEIADTLWRLRRRAALGA